MKRHTNLAPRLHLQHNFSDYPELHTHTFWEFTLFLSGTVSHFLNGESAVFPKNTLLVLRPNDCHCFQRITPTCEHINLSVEPQLFEEQLELLVPGAAAELNADQKPLVFQLSDTATKSYLQKALSAEVERVKGNLRMHEFWKAQIFLSLTKEFLYRNFMQTEERAETYLPDYLQKIISLLNDSENFTLSLKEIVQKTAYSYVHISRSFRSYMKVSLSDYFLAAKMNHARILLERGEKSVLLISEEVGYSNQSHFNLAFKKFFNTTPLKYKKGWSDFYDGLEEVEESE